MKCLNQYCTALLLTMIITSWVPSCPSTTLLSLPLLEEDGGRLGFTNKITSMVRSNNDRNGIEVVDQMSDCRISDFLSWLFHCSSSKIKKKITSLLYNPKLDASPQPQKPKTQNSVSLLTFPQSRCKSLFPTVVHPGRREIASPACYLVLSK